MMTNPAPTHPSMIEIYTYCPQCDWSGEADDVYCLKCGTRLEKATKKVNTRKAVSNQASTSTFSSQNDESPWIAILWSINKFISSPQNIRFSIATVLITIIAISIEYGIAEIFAQSLSIQPFSELSYSSPLFVIQLFLIAGLVFIPIFAIKMIDSMNSKCMISDQKENKDKKASE